MMNAGACWEGHVRRAFYVPIKGGKDLIGLHERSFAPIVLRYPYLTHARPTTDA